MSTYASFIRLEDRTAQNAQDLASIWGDAGNELAEFDAEIIDAYAMLGEYDFLVIYEAPDHEGALKSSLTLGRHGLACQTTEIVDVDDFAHLVEDF